MRFFIALEIPEQDKVQFKAIQRKLLQLFVNVRPTDIDKLHLTIAFIGNENESLKESIIEVIKEAANEIKPFTITPAYIDGFPHLHHANIIWVGVKGDIDKLLLLRHRIKDGLAKLGLPIDERRYMPHIAIAKTTKFFITEQQEKQLQEIMEMEFGPIEVSAVKLFESIPNHGFHSHNTLAEVKLT